MSSVEASWSLFEMEFPRHPHLHLDPLYALPPALINALQDEDGVGLTEKEWEFERALADWSAHGFFRKLPFVHPLLETGAVPRLARSTASRQQQIGEQLDGLLLSEMRRLEKTEAAIQRYCALTEQIQLRSRNSARAYLGWLATDPGFRQEFRELSSDWADRVWSNGAFPVLPVSVYWNHIVPDPQHDPEFAAFARLFLQRWSLEAVITPDLPLPLLPQLTDAQAYDPEWIGESGVSVYVPNYLFRQKSLSLAGISQLQQSFGHLRHLEGWLSHRTKDLGGKRFGYILDVYVYLELALKARYGGRLHGHTTSIDRAFGAFWKRGPRTAGGARQQLARRLWRLKSSSDSGSADK